MPQQVSAIWHKRQDRDQGLIWLREHFKRIISRNVELETAQVIDSLCKKPRDVPIKSVYFGSDDPPNLEPKSYTCNKQIQIDVFF